MEIKKSNSQKIVDNLWASYEACKEDPLLEKESDNAYSRLYGKCYAWVNHVYGGHSNYDKIIEKAIETFKSSVNNYDKSKNSSFYAYFVSNVKRNLKRKGDLNDFIESGITIKPNKAKKLSMTIEAKLKCDGREQDLGNWKVYHEIALNFCDDEELIKEAFDLWRYGTDHIVKKRMSHENEYREESYNPANYYLEKEGELRKAKYILPLVQKVYDKRTKNWTKEVITCKSVDELKSEIVCHQKNSFTKHEKTLKISDDMILKDLYDEINKEVNKEKEKHPNFNENIISGIRNKKEKDVFVNHVLKVIKKHEREKLSVFLTYYSLDHLRILEEEGNSLEEYSFVDMKFYSWLKGKGKVQDQEIGKKFGLTKQTANKFKTRLYGSIGSEIMKHVKKRVDDYSKCRREDENFSNEIGKISKILTILFHDEISYFCKMQMLQPKRMAPEQKENFVKQQLSKYDFIDIQLLWSLRNEDISKLTNKEILERLGLRDVECRMLCNVCNSIVGI